MANPIFRNHRPIGLVVFYGAMTLACVMATLPHPPALPGDPADKVQHVAAFATLALLAPFAYPRMPLPRIGERLSFLGSLIELVQSLPALQRDCSFWDWAADTAAVIVILSLVAFWRHGSGRPMSSDIKKR